LRVHSARQLANLPSSRAESDIFEDFVVLVQRVTYFVDCLFFRHNHFTIFKGLGLKEKPDFI